MANASLPDLCIFDLDGTLVDSLRDIAEALNSALVELGLPERPIADYRYMVGEGMPLLCRRAVGAEHPELVEPLLALARPRYRARMLHHTRPYVGVPELVRSMRLAGIKLAALSNKPHAMTQAIVNTFWPGDTFIATQGYVREEHRKPDPFHALEICAAAEVAPQKTWLIGDTPTDVLTARNAGANILAVTWGFRTRADLEAAGAECIVDSPAEIARFFNLE